jgi:hypothetical protein
MSDAGGRLANAGADVGERFALSSESLALFPDHLSGRLPLLPERFFPAFGILSERLPLLPERFSLLSERFSGRLSFLSKRFPLLPECFSLLPECFSLLSERFSLLSECLSGRLSFLSKRFPLLPKRFPLLPKRFFLAFGILSEHLPLLSDHFLQIIEVAVSFLRRLPHLYQSGPNEIALRKGGAHDGQRRQEYAQHFEDGDVVGDDHDFSILSPRVDDGV